MDVVMPQLGETVAEGKILVWFKNVGDEIKEGDNIFEVETDKVTIEVQAIVSGELQEIRAGAGTVAKVGTVVAVIGEGAKAATASVASQTPDRPVNGSAHRPALDAFQEVRTPLGYFPNVGRSNGVHVTPLARRMITQNGLEAAFLIEQAKSRGSKLVRAEDVRAALQGRGLQSAAIHTPPAQSPAVRLERLELDDATPLNTIRQRTGQRLSESWRTAPHVFQAIEIDFAAVEAVRTRHKDRFKERIGTSLTYLPFIARAVCLAIRDFPQVNARFDGDRLLVHRDINLGIAVDLSHNGLVVPVVHRASALSFEDLARAIARQIQKARAGTMTPDDMSGGTYTITNNGSYGTLFTAPIINLPQVAILSTDAIRKRPAVVETPQGDFIAVRPMGIVAQSFDHRAFDGAYSAAFLSCLKDVIERRDWQKEFD